MKQRYWNNYEQAFADLVDAPTARATALGRQALALLLKAVGVQEKDRIGVCAYTCLSVIEAVMALGANPVYLDVDENLCINPDSILQHPRDSLKVVILQHTFGNPGKLNHLMDACSQINAVVIEDCAHALGCKWNEKSLGCFGVGAIYSFQWGKPYTTGQGGMLTVNSQSLLSQVDSLLDQYEIGCSLFKSGLFELQRNAFHFLNGTWVERELRRIYRQLKSETTNVTVPGKLIELEKGYIQRPDRLTVKAGLRQIKNWPRNMEIRRLNTLMIESELCKHNMPQWPRQPQANITYLRYPVLVNNKAYILNMAREQSVDLAGWYSSPVHPFFGKSLHELGYEDKTAPRAEEAISKVVHMPTGRGMTPGNLSIIMKLLASEDK